MEFEWDKKKAQKNFKKHGVSFEEAATIFGKYMKKDNKIDELRPEYTRKDLGKGVRGRYYKDYVSGTNLVLLNPDVAAVFPDEKSVNDALRSLIKIAKNSTEITTKTT